MIAYIIIIASIFFTIGTLFGDLLTQNKDIPLSEQLTYAKHSGDCKKKKDVAFFTKMVIRELKKDLSKGHTTSYYSRTLWWKIENADVAKEVAEKVSQLTGLDFIHAPYCVGEYSIGCSDTTGKKES